MKSFLKALTAIVGVLYPIAIYVTLSRYDASPRILASLLVFVALVYFISHTEDARGKTVKRVQFWLMLLVAGILALITFLTENAGYLKFYPVSISIFLLFSFGITLIHPPNMIFRIANLKDKKVKNSQGDERKEIERYCRNVTIIWIVFFILNGTTAVLTALYTSPLVWALYNGMISYILMGVIFLGEIIVRKLVVQY